MGLFDIFKKKEADDSTGGMEDFMTLIRVYYQAVMAANLGITNLNALPDLRTFKQTLRVATVNNKLGVGEKNKCKKMLQDLYGMPDAFFKEIDTSIKRNCRTANDVSSYFYSFQGFSQDLLALLSDTMKWKLRMPAMFKNTLRASIAKEIHDYFTKQTWKDDAVRKGVIGIRKYMGHLGYSEDWVAEYAYNIIVLAKKESRKRKAANDAANEADSKKK